MKVHALWHVLPSRRNEPAQCKQWPAMISLKMTLAAESSRLLSHSAYMGLELPSFVLFMLVLARFFC